jgi:hypothetical protein
MPNNNRKKKMAARADKHLLYQQSVQCPEAEVHFFNKVFRKKRGRKPMTMREDFCGTAYLSTEWCSSHKRRTAVAIDLDGPTLEWGRKNVLAKVEPNVRERVSLHQANVLDGVGPKVDITCGMNFSYFIFKQRQQLIDYLKVVHAGLNDDGIFICELYGGTEAITEIEEEREIDGFTYIWEQASFNPITRETLCHIHFEFSDGSRLKKAFTYDWRLWTIPEVRECLVEAGFSTSEVWWEDIEKGGKYCLSDCEENQEGWLVYVIAER